MGLGSVARSLVLGAGIVGCGEPSSDLMEQDSGPAESVGSEHFECEDAMAAVQTRVDWLMLIARQGNIVGDKVDHDRWTGTSYRFQGNLNGDQVKAVCEKSGDSSHGPFGVSCCLIEDGECIDIKADDLNSMATLDPLGGIGNGPVRAFLQVRDNQVLTFARQEDGTLALAPCPNMKPDDVVLWTHVSYRKLYDAFWNLE